MAFLIGGANSAADTGYDIDYSLRFDGSSAKLHRAVSSAGNQKTWTFSGWIKRSNIGVAVNVFTAGADVSNRCHLDINASGTFQVEAKNSGTEVLKCEGGMKLVDPSAWYHIVWRVDTTDGTAANRSRVYINGNLVTFSSNSYPDQNTDMAVNDDVQHAISKRTWEDSNYFDGYMAELALIDGTSLAPSTFGESDEDSGIWKPKEFKDDVTFGTNGFYIYFLYNAIGNADEEAVGNVGADYSGEGNHYASLGIATTDRKTDTPTNNFATLNPLYITRNNDDGSYTEGNTKISWVSDNDDKGIATSTIGVTAGKWYWEAKVTDVSRAIIGVGDATQMAQFSDAFYDHDPSYSMAVYLPNGNLQENNTSAADWASDASDDDIVMLALDMDNHRCWLGINGTWQDSGDPTSGATGTGDMTTQVSDQTHINTGEFIFPIFADLSTSEKAEFEVNFGNPFFTVSSSNADANGYGDFEYAPPSGFYALCSKNLAEFGG